MQFRLVENASCLVDSEYAVYNDNGSFLGSLVRHKLNDPIFKSAQDTRMITLKEMRRIVEFGERVLPNNNANEEERRRQESLESRPVSCCW